MVERVGHPEGPAGGPEDGGEGRRHLLSAHLHRVPLQESRGQPRLAPPEELLAVIDPALFSAPDSLHQSQEPQEEEQQLKTFKITFIVICLSGESNMF